MNRFPPVLFAIGIMVAISGGAKTPEKVGAWPDSWPIFALGAVAALIGLVLWRRQKALARANLKEQMSAPGQANNPFELLAGLIEPARRLGAEIDTLGAEAICQRVDDLLETYVLPMAEVRQRVLDRLGMAAGAEVLVTVAFAERMLNRTWSAAGDEHLPEARAVYPDALEAFIEAQALAEKALASA
ncbi:MAG: hypothetical protein H6704_09645 [Myxococcales bacterium]|nr:hypothetical protein [Myxococcales bacterium]MCB9536517.1 hypothetical protein [Myxococcales bacterium]